MDNQKFVELAEKAVADYFNSHKEITDEGRLTPGRCLCRMAV